MKTPAFKRVVATYSVALSLGAVGWLYACPHLEPYTQSKPICRNCTASGAVPANAGAACTYQQSNLNVFCDCNPNTECRSYTDPDHTHWMTVQEWSGTCSSTICANPTSNGNSSYGWFIDKYSYPCPPSGE